MTDQKQVKDNLQNRNQWVRILYMALFSMALYFSMMIIALLIFVQVLFALITGSSNQNIRDFSAELTRYINHIFLFLSYNDERKPFPFAKWGQVENTQSAVNDIKA